MAVVKLGDVTFGADITSNPQKVQKLIEESGLTAAQVPGWL